MSYTAETFLAKIKPMVIEDMKLSGILASLTAAQALIESNKGNSGLAKKGNNLFGIKGNYKGAFVTMKTAEYYNSQKVYVNAQFRKYPSWRESIADHSDLFNRLTRYKNLCGLTDYKLACKYVKDDGYATSPTYTQTLLKTVETYRLYEWDAEVLNGNPQSNDPYPFPQRTLKPGAKGDDVKWLQHRLNLYGERLAVDGSFGPKTQIAVMEFQDNHGLEVDCFVGPKTRAELMKEPGNA